MHSKHSKHMLDSGERGASVPCWRSRNPVSSRNRVSSHHAPKGLRLPLTAAVARIARLKHLHRDERGTISIVSVFAIFMFTILLVMVTNVARHADDKIRMQNAADAAAQTGSVTIARGMNSIAFTNHLLSEVFALTAYMREAKQANQGTATLVPEILEEWRKIGQVFEQHGGSSGFEKFEKLGAAIQPKVPLEQAVVDAYALMSEEHSRLTLPVLEYILAGPNQTGSPGSGAAPADPLGGFIPLFQRAVVINTPRLAQLAADEVVERHGKAIQRQHEDQPLQARLWRTDLQMLGQGQIVEDDAFQRTLPVIDPSPTGPDQSFALMTVPYPLGNTQLFVELASKQRERLARHYLEQWIQVWMGPYFDFDDDRQAEGMSTAKMSNLINLWRAATCDHLERLLEEYPTTNLPHVIRDQPDLQSPGDRNARLEQEYTFVAVVYWPHASEMFPGLFGNPLEKEGKSDALTFAQSTVYLPIPRYVRRNGYWGYWVWRSQPQPGHWDFVLYKDYWPTDWDVLNQNWMAKLVPATSSSIVPILQSNPQFQQFNFRPPQLGGASIQDVRNINTH